MDTFAREAGVAPVEVRRINAVGPDQMPYTSATGALYDGGDYMQALDMALAAAGVDEVRARQRARRESGGNPLGLGMAIFVERAGGDAMSTEYARVEVRPDGSIAAFSGSSAFGQGHQTAFSQVVATALGVLPEQVEVVQGDTARVKEETGSFASRSTQIGASGLLRCAERVAAAARAEAAVMLQC